VARAYGVLQGWVSRLGPGTGPRARRRLSPVAAAEDLTAGHPARHGQPDHWAAQGPGRAEIRLWFALPKATQGFGH
jgi:hypothetical protein